MLSITELLGSVAKFLRDMRDMRDKRDFRDTQSVCSSVKLVTLSATVNLNLTMIFANGLSSSLMSFVSLLSLTNFSDRSGNNFYVA
jgi:hypothetical protein